MEKKVKDEDVLTFAAKWAEINSEEVFEIVLLNVLIYIYIYIFFF